MPIGDDNTPNVQTVRYEPLAYVNENCPHCHAEWGHFIICPLLNRNTAEARATLYQPSEADIVAAHGLGIDLLAEPEDERARRTR